VAHPQEKRENIVNQRETYTPWNYPTPKKREKKPLICAIFKEKQLYALLFQKKRVMSQKQEEKPLIRDIFGITNYWEATFERGLPKKSGSSRKNARKNQKICVMSQFFARKYGELRGE